MLLGKGVLRNLKARGLALDWLYTPLYSPAHFFGWKIEIRSYVLKITWEWLDEDVKCLPKEIETGILFD